MQNACNANNILNVVQSSWEKKNSIIHSFMAMVTSIEQESRAVAGNPRDAAVIFDP